MRRIASTILIGLLATGLAACADEKPLNPPPTSVAKSPTLAAAAGDDKAACATIKAARVAIVTTLLDVVSKMEDSAATADEKTKAAADLKTAVSTLRAETTKATSQAPEGKLKDALTAFGTGVDTALANVIAAGTDKDKLAEATDVAPMNKAEKEIMALCL